MAAGRLIALIFALFAATATAAAERSILPAEEQADWNAVGRLNYGAGFCSASLIAPDLVATSAHCLYVRRTAQQRPIERFHFVAGYRQGRFAGHARVAAATAHGDYAYAPKEAFATAGADLALLRLSAPLDVAPLSVGPAPRVGETLAVVSYGRDRREIASIARDCAVLRVQAGAVFLACDVTFGVSGAPVLRLRPEGPELVAVISAMGRGGRAAAALATGLADVPSP